MSIRTKNIVLTAFVALFCLVLNVVSYGQTPEEIEIEKPKLQADELEMASPKAKKDFVFYFRHDEFEIDLNYRNNAQVEKEFKNFLNNCIVVDSICIISSASPEGVYEHNVKLSNQRAKSFKNLILSIIDIENDKIHIYSKGEDWEGFHSFIEEYYYKPERNKVLDILNADIKNDTKKWRLKQIDEGKTFADIIYNFAYRFRTANSIIVYGIQKPDSQQVEAIEKIESIEDIQVTEEIVNTEETKVTEEIKVTEETEVIEEPTKNLKTIFALKTNLLFDLGTFLNYAVEVPIGERISIQAQSINPWFRTKNNQYTNETITLGGDLRFWLGDRTNKDRLIGHHIGLYAFSGKADLQWKRSICYQTRLVSAGISYGFALPIGKALNLEFCIAAGLARLNYQHYLPEEDYSILYRDYNDFGTMLYLGPTKAEISLVIPIKANIGGKKR